MIRGKDCFNQRRFALSIALIVFSGFAVAAKPGHAFTPRPNITAPAENVFNLSDFDPVGDGVADDGPALQRALDALAGAGGGTLFIPAGRYRIVTPVAGDFSSVPGARITIQGVASATMPAPVTATGEELAAGLDLTSEIIPATGKQEIAITLSNLDQLLMEHVGFMGTATSATDSFISLYLTDIDNATIRHCEFYGLSSFGIINELGGGNIVRALRSALSIESSVFLGCTANSGAYAPVVENVEWKKFSISNSIFLDYGLGPFFSKTGLGAPLSWIGIEQTALRTPSSPRREVIVRDTFLDEGGWVGFSVLPYRWSSPPTQIDLIYISGLKMNVSNTIMTGHLIYDTRNVMIENSHYGWSHNAYAAIDINRVENAILDKLTCIDHADRIRTDDRTGRLAVINSVYNTLDSLAPVTTVLETEPDQDPVQYVRNQFTTVLGRAPDAAAHFYWSDRLIRCDANNECVNRERSALSEYLDKNPQPDFSIAGTVRDEAGNPVSGVAMSLTGSHAVTTLTDSQGKYRFSDLPTSGSYTLTANVQYHTVTDNTRTFTDPAGDVTADFEARVNRHSIAGRILKFDGTGFSGVTVQLAESPTMTATTDSDGLYSFPDLPDGNNYTVVPSPSSFVFNPENFIIENLDANQVVNFVGDTGFRSLTVIVKDENDQPLSDVVISLTGSTSSLGITDSGGSFQFSDLPASGSATATVAKRHYTFATDSQTIEHPTSDVSVTFRGVLNRHTIRGRVTMPDGTAMSGVTVQLADSSTITATTDSNGSYSFADLMAGRNYTVVPSLNGVVFGPVQTVLNDLSADQTANFVGAPPPELLLVEGSQLAIALDTVQLTEQPFSVSDFLGIDDGFTRVMIFARNLDWAGNPSQVSVVANDDGQPSPVEIEFIGNVPGQSWMKQINLKLPSDSVAGKCLQLKLSTAVVDSNDARICFATPGSPASPVKQ